MVIEFSARQREQTPAATDAGVSPLPVIPPFRLVLDLDAVAAEKLRRAPLLLSHATKRPLTRQIDLVYWDTQGNDLGAARLALGVQRVNRRAQQIMSSVAQPLLGGYGDIDIIAPMDGERPDPVRLAFLPGADAAVVSAITTADLLPLFGIAGRRTRWAVAYDGATFVAQLDGGEISAGGGRRNYCQLTLELTGGRPAGLYEFARALRQTIAFHLASHDAVRLGYRLATGKDGWADAYVPSISKHMTTRAGILEVGRGLLAEVRKELARLDAAPTQEAVHSARVALRRLRSLFSVCGAVLPNLARRIYARELRDLAARIGAAREWDVFATEIIDPILGYFQGDPALVSVRLTANVLREQAAEATRGIFSGAGFLDLSLQLGAWFDAGLWPQAATGEHAAFEAGQAEETAWLERPLAQFAREVLKKRRRRILRLAKSLVDPHPDELHGLRIELKKLRYASEFFAPLFSSRATKRYVASLRSLQDVLGQINDAATLPTLLPHLIKSDARDGRYVSGIITGWTAAHAAQARTHYAQAWEEFVQTKRFWRGD